MLVAPSTAFAQQQATIDSVRRTIVGSWISVDRSFDGMEVDSLFVRFVADGRTVWRGVRTLATEGGGRKRQAGSPRLGQWRVRTPLDPADDRIQLCVSFPKDRDTSFCGQPSFRAWMPDDENRTLLELRGSEELNVAGWRLWRVSSLFAVRGH
jgi:hypothetical protein